MKTAHEHALVKAVEEAVEECKEEHAMQWEVKLKEVTEAAQGWEAAARTLEAERQREIDSLTSQLNEMKIDNVENERKEQLHLQRHLKEMELNHALEKETLIKKHRSLMQKSQRNKESAVRFFCLLVFQKVY